MKHSYFIRYINNQISIQQYDDRAWVALKNRGEPEQTYNEQKFWQWFLEKIEYQSEKLSFVVVTDNKDFIIPDSSPIILNDLNPMQQDEKFLAYVSRVSQGYFILSFPKQAQEYKKEAIEKPTKKHAEQHPAPNNNIANIFRTKTKGYENG